MSGINGALPLTTTEKENRMILILFGLLTLLSGCINYMPECTHDCQQAAPAGHTVELG